MTKLQSGILLGVTILLAHFSNSLHWPVAFTAMLITLFALTVCAIARYKPTNTQWILLVVYLVVSVLITVSQRN